ncbi:MAG: hypothetical protein ABWJ42_05500 [Sulfolobales archaeon]
MVNVGVVDENITLSRKPLVIDTSIFLLIEDGYSVLDGLSEEIEESYMCVTTDSVIREMLRFHSDKRDLILRYLEKIFNECSIETVSEDLEREDADHDLIRVSLLLRAPLITLDRELKREARRSNIELVLYRVSKKRIETP